MTNFSFPFKASICFLLLLPLWVSAQSPHHIPAHLEWGPKYNEPAGTEVEKIVHVNHDGFYVLRTKTPNNTSFHPKAYLEYFSRKMKLLKSNELPLKFKNKRLDFEDVISFGGELYLLTSFNNQAKKTKFLFKQSISKKSLSTRGSLEMIAETTALNKERAGTFGFNVSEDSSKLLIYNQLPNKRKDPAQFALHVFDQNFDKLWSKNIALPYPENTFGLEEYRIDNQGNVYLLGVLYQDKVSFRRRGTPDYQYIILAYNQNGDDAREYRIDLPNKFITDLTFRIQKNGNLVCSGFYADLGTYNIKGTYFFQLNPKTREILHENHKAFSFESLTEFMSDREKRKADRAKQQGDTPKQPELYQYSLDKLILRSDGGAVLVAEQYYFYQTGGYNYYNQYVYTNHYNYNDIFVVNIRPNGEIEWTARIPKRQKTENDNGYFSSYAMAVVRDKLYFVFNDNGRNYSGQRPNRLYNFNGKNSVIALAEVSKDGEVSIAPIAENREAAILTRPRVCRQIGSRQMAIFGERQRTFRFGSLRFE
ncbi:MAG: hypothetical protein D6714_21025 [Bacteroidetes bacterium]|nr:MAG: hypothetical protein D6714_21025 [Bacteroidota bacterium]